MPDLDVNLLCYCSQLMPMLVWQRFTKGHFLHLSICCLVGLDSGGPISSKFSQGRRLQWTAAIRVLT